jgi:DNA repair exonuclease SbcCD ATPase subunit
MMIVFKTLTLKNFLSTGAVTQAVNLNTDSLTLVLGENLDLGGNGAKNGVGKSTILQALHYVLFGISIGNAIKRDNLINKTNERGMLVTLQFSVNGVDYELRRGRKPNVLQFLINDEQQDVGDSAQGESRETQREIERLLNLTPELFTQLTLLSTYTTPFLALKSADQRSIIESLLGISQLSERAELIKEGMRVTREEIVAEEHKIRATLEANKRITEQIESLQRRQRLWNERHTSDITTLELELADLSKCDITAELAAHTALSVWTTANSQHEQWSALVNRHTTWLTNHNARVGKLRTRLDQLNKLDIQHEIAQHAALVQWNENNTAHTAWSKSVTHAERQLKTARATQLKIANEVEQLLEHKCYACGSAFHDERHTTVLQSKQEFLENTTDEIARLESELAELNAHPVVINAQPVTHYATAALAHAHSSEIESTTTQIAALESEPDPYSEQIAELQCPHPGPQPVTLYATEKEALQHSARCDTIATTLHTKRAEADPYSEQIDEMQNSAIVEVSYDQLNDLNRLHDHQKFLHDLLTNKDSFVRKRIIEQNLAYLNSRLQHYLDRLHLAHTVQFKNNLEVDIAEFGRELDFGNLSRGEQNRVVLALSFAFRDLYEALFHGINGLYVDELIDSGMDSSGVEHSVALLKEMSRNGRSVLLISHREELSGRVGNVLKVIKEGGFTTYETD